MIFFCHENIIFGEVIMSSKKKTYLFILIFAIILLAIGFAYDIAFIKSLYYNTLTNVSKPLILVPAVICAFIFLQSGYYWLLMLVCAFGDAFVYLYMAGRRVYSFEPLAITAFAFLVIVYLLNFVKSIIKD